MTQRGIVVGDRVIGQAADSHPDWIAGFGALSGYSFVGASAIGKMHIRDVRPRDDSFAVRSVGEWLAVAVSDGVGSRKQSRYGSSLAVEALCEHLLRQTDNLVASSETPQKVQPQGDSLSKPAALSHAEKQPSSSRLSPAEEERLVRIEEKLRQFEDKESRVFLSSLLNWFRGMNKRTPKLAENSDKAFSAHEEVNRQESHSDFAPPSEERMLRASPGWEASAPPLPLESPATSCGTLTWHWQDLKSVETLNPTEVNNQETRRPVSLEEGVRIAFQKTRENLEQFAQSRGVDIKELHCTLMGVLLNTKTGQIAVGHIGDGLVACFGPDHGAHMLVEAPTPGEVGEVYIITQNHWEKYLAIRELTPQEAAKITTFYLMTDGVADDYINPPPVDIFARWTKDIDREMRKDESLSQRATKLLHWLNTYEVGGSYDDRTLVVVMRET